MKIQFLESSILGVRWMRRYYRERPQLKENGSKAYKNAKIFLKEKPHTGKEFDEIEGVLERSILRTPFSILYTVKNDIIYIIDIRDGRGYRSENAVREFTQILKKKYNLL